MDYLTLGLVLWIALFILLGMVRGFWKALAAVVSLVGAYLASAYFAPKLSAFLLRVFAEANLGETVTWAASATLIFVLAGLLIRLVIVLIARSKPITHRPTNAIGGALLSGAHGALIGLLIIWSLSFLLETYQPPEDATDTLQAEQLQQSPPAVVTLSRRLMADIVGWNARKSGASQQTAQIATAYARQPKQVLDAVQSSLSSEEFKRAINSENVKKIVRENNVDELRSSPEFAELMQQPGMQALRELIAADDAQLSEEAAAQQMLELWRGVDELRSNPELSALLQDREVREFFDEGGEVTPSLLAKGQDLLRALASGGNTAAKEPPELYQWYDDEDQLQVTEYHEIPLDKQNRASRIPL